MVNMYKNVINLVLFVDELIIDVGSRKFVNLPDMADESLKLDLERCVGAD